MVLHGIVLYGVVLHGLAVITINAGRRTVIAVGGRTEADEGCDV